MKIYNRRYTGSKFKLVSWIRNLLLSNCKGSESFCDIFAGTGVVTYSLLDVYKQYIVNDFLYSNEIIYKAFFLQEDFDYEKLRMHENRYNFLNAKLLSDNYVSDNYGNKYFSVSDAKIIGYIREDIDILYSNRIVNEKEYCILLASLLYSFDKISNTVGHYEAFIKGKDISDGFIYELIEPVKTNNRIDIFRMDANELAKRVNCDIVFIDPPYNSRQYSRFYHVMETITKWDKPTLKGVAMKPPEENMSDYCRNAAREKFTDLIGSLQTKYIAVTYNNTYNSKSTSSQNKIALEEIEEVLSHKGPTKIFSTQHNAFNAGKTDMEGHKEFLFITEVK